MTRSSTWEGAVPRTTELSGPEGEPVPMTPKLDLSRLSREEREQAQKLAARGAPFPEESPRVGRRSGVFGIPVPGEKTNARPTKLASAPTD